MILRLSRLRVPDDRSLEILSLVREQISPAVRETPGIVAMTYGFRREGPDIAALTVTAWRSFADMNGAQGATVSQATIRAWLGDLADQIEREHYELVSTPAEALTLEGGVLGLVWGRVKPNAEGQAHEMIRNIEARVLDAGALALHVARRVVPEGTEILALAQWPSRSVLRAFTRSRSQGALDPAFLALLTEWRFETYDCLDLERVLVPPSGPAVVLADPSGRFVDASSGVEPVVGVPDVLLVGRSLADLVPEEQRDAAAAAWATFLREGTFEARMELLRPDGRGATVEVRGRTNTPDAGLHALVLTPPGAAFEWPAFADVVAEAFSAEAQAPSTA